MAKILVIDDSRTARAAVQLLLHRNGYETLEAESGEAGLELAAQEKPDAILMDIAMPGMGGFNATRQLTKTPDTSTIPVVMLSSKAQESDKIWARAQGARDYLVKPAREDELMNTLGSLLV